MSVEILEAAKRPVAAKAVQTPLLKRIIASLEDDKAENIVAIDLAGRSSLCDAHSSICLNT